MAEPPKDLIRPLEAAAILGVVTATVRNMAARGELVRYSLGGSTARYSRAEVTELARKRQVQEPTEYPEHDKLLQVKPSSQPAGEFFDWLTNEAGYTLAKSVNGKLYPAYANAQDLLARWLGIDQDRLEQEKRVMLSRLQESNKTEEETP